MFEQEVIEVDAFDEVAGVKAHVVEFGEVKDMGFEQDGGGDVEFAADIGEVIEKVGIGKFFLVVLVDELFGDLAVAHNFCPDSEHKRLRMFF